MSLDDFKPVKVDTGAKLDDSDFQQFLDILKRFNLIQQKNSQKLEDLRAEAAKNLEKSLELNQKFISERTELREQLSLYEKTLLEVLDLLDNMESIARETGNKTLTDFMGPAKRSVGAILGKLGWSLIPTEDIKVDASLHYVVHQTNTSDPGKLDQVAGVVRSGYRCGDRVIRRAEVSVYQ